mgnify:CR=1 FL=1
MKYAKIVLPAALTLITLFLFYFLYTSLQEHNNIKKNSITYFLLVDDLIKEVSEISDCRSIFSYIPADGVSPEIQKVEMRACKAGALQKIDTYLSGKGYKLVNNEYVLDNNVITRTNYSEYISVEMCHY